MNLLGTNSLYNRSSLILSTICDFLFTFKFEFTFTFKLVDSNSETLSNRSLIKI